MTDKILLRTRKPQPDPWFVADSLACRLISAATIKAAAARIADRAVADQLSRAAQDDIDDICPRKPHPHGPRPHQLASELLVGIAANLKNEALRGEILAAAKQAYESASPVVG